MKREEAPLVSVLMPARNAERTISASIESVLGQTLADTELIVIDDGSDDRTGSIARRYREQDRRVTVLTTDGVGASAARNAGLVQASGRYVAMLDADDLAVPQRLERQVRFLEHDRALAGAASRAVLFVKEGKPLGFSAVSGPASRTELWRTAATGKLLVFAHSTVIWRADALRSLGGFDRRFQQAEDAELVNRAVYRHGLPLVVMPEALVWYRITATGLSSQGLALQRRVLRYLEERNRAWLSGETPRDIDSYLADPLSIRTRSRWWRHDVGATLYRRAGIDVGEDRLARAIPQLVGAVALHPRYVAGKLWRQRFARPMAAAPPQVSPDA